MSILDETEFTEVEGRGYLNPQVALDESNTFIDNLRSTQGANNQQIQTDTYNLGTAVPTNLGGLGGSTDYWAARYSTPQTTSAVNDLRAAAQASALNQVLANEEAIWKKRYKDAYRAYEKSAHDNDYVTNTGDITTENTTVEVGNVTTDALSDAKYKKLLLKYRQEGYSIAEAEALAKKEMGVNAGPTVESDYKVYTLPNGKTILVDETKYELIKDGSTYMFKERETGKTYKVGE